MEISTRNLEGLPDVSNRTLLRDRGGLPRCALPQGREDVVARGIIGKIPLKKGEECESLVLRQPIRFPSGSFWYLQHATAHSRAGDRTLQRQMAATVAT
jgi:hypothetical protein